MPWWIWVQVIFVAIFCYTLVGALVAKVHWSFWPAYKSTYSFCRDEEREKSWEVSVPVGVFWPVTFPIILGVILVRKIQFPAQGK